MIIAIDGPAASGKGSIARRLGAHFGYPHLDTGALYRAVGLAMLQENQNLDDSDAAAKVAENLPLELLDAAEIRTAEVGEAASKVAVHAAVRKALRGFQERFAGQSPGAVLDGRDIGTVICPHADVKLFITATVEIRATRRHKELLARGERIIYGRVLADLKVRDQRDATRKEGPLRPADDAFQIDTSDLDIEAAVAAALTFITSQRT
jgi:cytidylate kinase